MKETRTTKKAVGRPRAEWDENDKELFRELCGIFCTRKEVCSVFGVSEKTLNRLIDEHFRDEIKPGSSSPITYQDAFDVFSAAGKASLRRIQYKKALEGNTTMLIWLGKQYLEQEDSKLVVEQAQNDKTQEEPLGDILTRRAEAGMPASNTKGQNRS